MSILCTSCAKPLVIVLQPDEHLANAVGMWCRACQHAVDAQVLQSRGASAELIERIAAWARQSGDIMGWGCVSRYGGALSDVEYVRAWRATLAETVSLLRELAVSIPTEMEGIEEEVVAHWPAWTDQEIVRWRHQKIRLRHIDDYACLLAVAALARGETAPAAQETVQVPHPQIIATPEEQQSFRRAYYFFARLASMFGSSLDAGNRADLERALGIPPDPSD